MMEGLCQEVTKRNFSMRHCSLRRCASLVGNCLVTTLNTQSLIPMASQHMMHTDGHSCPMSALVCWAKCLFLMAYILVSVSETIHTSVNSILMASPHATVMAGQLQRMSV